MTFEELMGAYKINDDLCNKAVYDELLKQLKNDRVTPVIGAGLSVWAGYPLWSGLLIKKAKGTKIEAEVNELIKNNEFEKAATKVSEFYRKNTFLRALQAEFSADKIDEEKRPEYQYLLKEIFKGPFVTTNYDKALDLLLNAAYTVNPQDEFNETAINDHIQNHKHFLVKLHGTVDDPVHMILTEVSYNNAYGDDPKEPDKNKPLPKALETIFKASPPLFLGCSLGNDRTCAVFKNCVGTTGFALVEMPDNKADFDEKDAQLDDMNLQVIWYPHGKHEAVEVLINQLAKDMGIGDPPDPDEGTAVKPDKQEIQYKGTGYFIGRDSIVNDIAEKFNNPETKVLLVHGMAGIGKTEICKAVYRKLKAENPDFSMPFVDITGKSSLPDFWKSLADGLDIDVPNTLPPEKLFDFICNHVYNKDYIAYLDNFEDILIALDKSG
ncbi:MAG: SIR2 family protein, partial [Ruminococcus sp.]|nr:SIR2 family protein [Ruminococcus sp.]